MMTTWRLVGHNEATLRNLCQEKLPASQSALKLLLMKELDGITKVPERHSITELMDETTEYFLPAKNTDCEICKKSGCDLKMLVALCFALNIV
jgi:hypothetical protein